MSPHNQNRTAPLIMELKFDGNNITGTVTGPPNPGEIKTGTYDPKTGALKLGVDVKGNGGARFEFEGTVVAGTAIGRVSGGNQTGNFKIIKGNWRISWTTASGRYQRCSFAQASAK